VSANIVLRNMGCWSLIPLRVVGNSRIATLGCSAWQNAFWNRTWRREKS